MIFVLIFLNTLLHFSPCSGLEITSYSKYPEDTSFMNFLSAAIEQYKTFKKEHMLYNKYSHTGNIIPATPPSLKRTI